MNSIGSDDQVGNFAMAVGEFDFDLFPRIANGQRFVTIACHIGWQASCE